MPVKRTRKPSTKSKTNRMAAALAMMRAASLTKERRREIAREAARARWNGHKPKKRKTRAA